MYRVPDIRMRWVRQRPFIRFREAYPILDRLSMESLPMSHTSIAVQARCAENRSAIVHLLRVSTKIASTMSSRYNYRHSGIRTARPDKFAY